MEKLESKWIYIVSSVFVIIWLLLIFEPKGYDYIVFAISSALLAYVGYTRRENMIYKFAILLGIILFIISVVLYFLK